MPRFTPIRCSIIWPQGNRLFWLLMGLSGPLFKKPEPEFSSTPAAGAGLGFGEWPVGELSDAEAIQVQNTGDAELTLSCALSGTGQGAYTIANCPAAVPASGTGQVSLTCTPPSAGP